MSGIYGTAMAIGGERWTQTLSPLLATPANRIALFLGRSLPLIANGIIVSAFAFAAGWLLLDFSLPASRIPALALVVVVSAFSCTALGLMVGAIGLRACDVFFFANLVVYLLLLFCGTNVPLDSLPGWMETEQRAATHARDRGCAADRVRCIALGRWHPRLDGGRDRGRVCHPCLRPFPFLRGGGAAARDARDDLGRQDRTGRRIRAEQAHFPIPLLCRMLGASRSDFYALGEPALRPRVADAWLSEQTETRCQG